MVIVDAEGNRYQVDLPQDEQQVVDGVEGSEPVEGGATKEPSRPTITKLEDVKGVINTKELSEDAGFNVRFSAGDGKYAFDEGREAWYQNAKLVRDDYYKPFGENYIAPWKLVPLGQTDLVEAVLAGASDALGKLDRSKIKFVLDDGSGVAAKDDGQKWTLSIAGTDIGKTYDIFAVYEKNKSKLLTVGKLRVVSYAVQRHTVTLVPVNGSIPDVGALEQQLNAIYSPYGVEFTVNVDDAIKDLEGWKGRAFKLEGNGFFTRENADMAEIRKAYQSAKGSSKDGYYVFVLGAADASAEDKETQAHGAQGDMPRGQQFGYIFGDQVRDLGWLLAHELGHGVFTLKHLNESNYAGKSSLGTLPNLMDYTGSTLLAAFQWNVMSNPAILTGLDSDDASKGGETDRLSLSFDGKFLKLRVVEKGEILRFSYSAVSGRPHDNGSFDYSKERQKIKSEGPLPEGEYCINPQEITYADDREFWDKIKGYFGRGTFPGSPDILGNYATP